MKKFNKILLLSTIFLLVFAQICHSNAGYEWSLYYTVKSGDSLYSIAQKFEISVDSIKNANGKTSNLIYSGEKLKINVGHDNYIVKSGDTLFKVALKYATTVGKIKLYSDITSDNLNIGQVLKVPAAPPDTSVPAPSAPAPAKTPAPTAPPSQGSAPYITYTTHKVASGDNIWDLSIRYGIPQQELLNVNNLTTSSSLSIGQILTIPIHHVPITSTPGAKFGEYLDWWTQAQYVFPIGKTALITDFNTGRSFTIKRTIGAGHADCEPLTASDAAAMKSIWGGSYSWITRPVIVNVDGRKIAGSITSMEHGVEYISGNSFLGHFDLYFKNCIRHVDGKPDPYHAASIKIAAGQ